MQYDLSDSKESDSKEQIILSCNFDYNDRHDLIQAAKATKLASTGVVQPGLLMLIHEKTSKSSSVTYPDFPRHNDHILFVQRTLASGVWRTDHVDGLLPFQRPASNHDEDHRAAAARGAHRQQRAWCAGQRVFRNRTVSNKNLGFAPFGASVRGRTKGSRIPINLWNRNFISVVLGRPELGRRASVCGLPNRGTRMHRLLR